MSFSSNPGMDGVYTLGDTISVDVTFFDPTFPEPLRDADVTGSPTLTITIGTKAAVAKYVSVSGNVVTFEYTTVEGDIDADGISIPANSINLNGGEVKLYLFSVQSYDHAAVTSTHTVDATTPTLSITYAGSEGVDYVPPGQAYRVQFTFSEPVGAFILQDVVVANGAISGFSRMAATQEHPQSTRWEANVLPPNQGASVVKVEADAASDAAGNLSLASNVLTLWVANPQHVNVQREAGGLIEGGTPAFKLTRASGDVAISVAVTITQSGDFSDGTVSISRSSHPEDPTSSSLTFPGAGVLANLINPPGTSLSASLLVNFAIGETEKLIELPTTDDAEYEANGGFTLTVERKLDQFLYIPGSNFTATATVIDNDAPPTISIAAVEGTVGEGELARLIITRTTGQFEHSGHIPVTIEWTQTGNYITPITETVRFAHDQVRLTLLIQTTDDQTPEPHGSVTATVVASDQGRYRVGSPSSASVVVQDDDGARITIEPVSANVTEGTSAVFRVRRHGDTSETIIVLVTVWGHEKVMSRYTKLVASRGLLSNSSDATVVFASGSTERTFTLTTEADNRVEGDGEIWIGLLPSPHNSYFTDGAPSPNAAVLVVDDDIPTISIAAVTTPEGATLSEDGTTWNASTVEGEPISIRYECSGSFEYGTAVNDRLSILNTWVSETNHPGFYDDRTVGARGLNHMESNVVHVTTADCSSVLNAHDSLRNHRWVGPAGGEVRIDMVPWDTIDPPLYAAARASYATALADAQTQGVPLTTPGLFSPQGVPHNSMRPWLQPSEVRFLPKYQIGTTNAVRVSLVNRDPTILIKADTTEVAEGSSATFTVERRWNAENLADTSALGATVVLLRASTVGPFVTQTLPTMVQFASGETSKTITIQTSDDMVYSPDGSVTVELLPDTTDATLNLGAKYSTASTWAGHTPAGGRSDQASVAILDNDPGVLISHATLAVPEGGTNTYTIRLVARQPTSDVTITIVNPTDNTEVTASPAHLTFTPANWAIPQLVTVSAASDTDSTDDTATVTHTAAGAQYEGFSVPDLPVTVVEELTVEFAASSYTVAEGKSVDVTVTLSDDPHGTLIVPLTSTPQGNTSAADYTAPASVTFEAGETSQTVTFTATDDSDDDNNEQVLLGFPVTLPTGLAAGTTNQTTVTITDRIEVMWGSSSYPVAEGERVVVSVQLSQAPEQQVTINLNALIHLQAVTQGGLISLSTVAYSGGTVTSDYSGLPASVTFEAGETEQTFSFMAIDDTDDDDNEVVDLIFSSVLPPGIFAGTPAVASLAIEDKDVPDNVYAFFAETSYTATEGDSVTVEVRLNQDPERTVVVPITATPEAGATSADYSGVPANVTFNSGDTSKTFTLTLTDDDVDDDNERVVLGFGTQPNGVVSGTPASSTVNIDDNDTSGIVLVPTALTVTEEDAAGTSYTVKLGSQPTSNVTVTISGHADTALTLSGTGLSGDELTFTTTDWSTAQTVVVKAAHDDNAVNETITLTHTPSGGGYASTSNDLPVTVNDDDPAVTVMFGQSSYTVAEGATVDVTVTLSADPERTVVIPITATNLGGATSADYSGVPATVTFNSGDTSQTITFSATDDTLDDDSESVALGFGTMPETGVTAGTPNQATVDIDDNDTLGIVFIPTSLTVTEEDAAGTSYTVELGSQPTGTVTVTISGHADTALTLSGTGLSGDELTFTTTDWSTAQTVVVKAAHDDNAVNESVTLTHTASGGGYASASNDLPVTVTDDDPSVTVMFGQSSYTVAEGSTVDVTVTLSADPERTVVVPITATNHGGATSADYSGVPATVTFNSGDTSQTITFSATDDTLDDDSESVALGFGTMPETGVTAGTPNQATVDIDDNDTLGIVFIPTSLTVTEEDAAGTSYTVELGSQPTGTVTVTISGHADTALTLSGTGLSGDELTFTTTDWSTAQTVVVKAAHDDNAVNESVTLTHTASGGGYASASNDLPVTVTDDDPSVTVMFGQSSYTVAEGATVDVTVTLSADPERTVVVPITATNHGGATSADYSGVPATVTFNSGDTSQTITFSATDDTLDDDSESVALGFGTMPETGVTAGTPNQATVDIDDNDTLGIVFIPTSLTVTEEDAAGTSYTVELGSQPTGTVTVTISGHADTALTLSGTGLSGDELTFTTTDWSTAQTVVVKAAHDDNAVNESVTLTHTASGGGYASASNDLPVTVTDDDPSVTVMFGQSSYTVAEGATVDVTVTLSADPERTVVVPITATNHGGATSADYSGVPATVTFNSGDTSQTITFSATDDTLDDDSESVALGFGTMPETGVTAGTPNQATVDIDDNDTLGIVFIPTSLTVTEEDAAGTSYTVELGSQPTGTVTVTISGHADTALTLSGTGLSGDELTFTTTDWSTAQTVVVKAAHDDNAVNESVTLTHTASGGGYASASNDLPVTVTDDDPSVTVMFGQSSYTVAEGATVDVTVTLSADPERTVVVPITATNHGGATSADYSGVPATVTFNSGDTSQTITFSATDDTLDDDSESVALGFGTMPETGVTAGTPNQATVDIDDNDTLGIVFIPTSLTVTEEDAAGTSYTVELGSQPTGTVTVTISGHADTALTLSGTGLSGDELTFTTTDWSTAQTVVVKAAHDDNAVNESVTLTHTASGGGYASASNDLPVTVTDDDPSVTVMFGQSSYTVAEGATVDVTVTLSADPERTVVVPITATNHGGATSADYSGVPATVTFNSGDTSQTITFSATDDTLDDDSESVALGFGTMPETGVTAGTPNQATVDIDDNDTLGIVFIPTSLTVTEEDAAGTSYTVELGSQPTGTVTVTISGHADTALTLSGTGLSGDELTFTTTDWSTAQTVVVKAAHDDNAVNESVTLTHTASGGGYASASNDLPVTVTDDDPSVTVMFGQSSYTVAEGSTVDVTVTLSADPERTVVVPITATNHGGATSADYSGVPATVTFNSGDTSQTITFSATDDTLDDDSESVALGFGTMPETGVTAGTPNQATVDIDDNDTLGTIDCSAAIWCADLEFSDQSTVDWGRQKLQHGKSAAVDPPSSLSDDSFTFRGVDYVVGSIVLEAGTYPTLDNDWSRDKQADSRLRVAIRRADDGSNVPLTHYEDWVLHINGLELLFEDAFRVWAGGFLWVTPKLQEPYNNWQSSSVTKIGIREVDSNQDPTAGLPWAPTLVRAYGQHEHMLKLRWWRPQWAEFGPKVTGYALQWKPASANWTDTLSVSERRLGRGEKIVLATVTGLAPNTLYTVRVAALNDARLGPWSDDSLARTQPGSHSQAHASVNGSEVTLHFGFPLDEARTPVPSSFVVLVDNGVGKVDSVQVVGSTVVLTLEEAVHGHNTVQALYEEPSDSMAAALHDTDGHRIHTIRYEVPEAVNLTPKSEVPPLTGSITNVPSAHDGATPITFNVEFSEKVWIALGLPKDDMLEVEGGRVTSAHPVDRITKKWEVTIQPETRGNIVVTLPGGFCTSAYVAITASDHVPGAPCAPGDRILSNRPTETIRGPESSQQLVYNSPPQGTPRINGIPEVEQTLSADTSGISDNDGLDNAVFVFSWLADEEAIEGADGSSYLLAEGDLGKAIRVKVDFADDAGNPESLTSEPTSPVEAADLELQSATVDGSTLTLTYNKTLDTAVSTLPSAFAVDVNGNSRPVMAVAVGQSNVLLSLSAPVEAGDAVTVDYTAPTEEGAARVQDTSGNAAASFSGQDVTNSTAERANNPATGTPTISGTAQVGLTLTAATSGINDADGLDNVSFSYEWLADDTAISNADAGTYELTSAEEGKAIKVKVDFTDDAGNPETLTSAATAAVAARPNSPATGTPTISGTAQVGLTLTAATSGINDADGLDNVSFSYEWLADDTAISNADAGTYELTSAEEGKAIKVKVDFTDDAGNPETLTSAATAAVAARPNSPATGTPTISGTAQVGLTLTAATSGINDADGLDNVSFSYEWLADDTAISNADAGTYELTSAEEGKAIKVKVDFTDDAGNPETLTSAATAAVAARPNSPATGTPTISGTAQVGLTLTAATSGINDADGLDNVSFSYEWLADDTAISNADAGTYELTSAEEGKAIKVKVDFTDDAGNPETLTSAATAAVAAAVSDAPEVVWSVEMTVKHYGYGDVGAASPELFSNETGGLEVVWLWYSPRERRLYLSFQNPVPNAAESTLRLDDVSLPFPVESSSTAFTFAEVDISWTDGQVVAVSIVR